MFAIFIAFASAMMTMYRDNQQNEVNQQIADNTRKQTIAQYTANATTQTQQLRKQAVKQVSDQSKEVKQLSADTAAIAEKGASGLSMQNILGDVVRQGAVNQHIDSLNQDALLGSFNNRQQGTYLRGKAQTDSLMIKSTGNMLLDGAVSGLSAYAGAS